MEEDKIINNYYRSKKFALVNKGDNFLFNKTLTYLKPGFNEKILEIGCGRGFFVKKIEKFTKFAVGIDVNPEAIKNSVSSKIKLADATNTNFPSASFDKIYSLHTIEHVPNLKKLFSEIDRILKPGGKVLLVYPWELIRGIGAIVAALIIFKNPFYCRKIHLHKIYPSKIKKIIKDSNLEHVESHFIPFKFPQFFTILKKRSVVYW